MNDSTSETLDRAPANTLNGPVRPASLPGDEVIAEMLKSANIPTLLATLVHLTGDTAILTGPVRPSPQTLGDEQGGLTEDEKESVRQDALKAIAAFRDAGCPQLPRLPDSTILDIMSLLAGEPMPAEYVPLLLEEMRLADRDERQLRWTSAGFDPARTGFKVAIIGAGISGVLAAIRLAEAGVPYTVYEKNAGVGGTWFENVYPGCRVDNPSHFYSYSFAQKLDWTHSFSKQPDLLDYVSRLAAEHDILGNVQFGTEVTALHFNDETAQWTLKLRSGNNDWEAKANAVVAATGQLNQPKPPQIEGVGTFAGTILHTGAWDPHADLKGKRVGVIGTGASAMQLVPEIAPDVACLALFQRSPPWIYPTPAYQDAVPEGHKWLMEHVPYYANWFRFWLFWTLADGLLPMVTVDPAWGSTDRAVNAANDEARANLTAVIHEELADRPDLIEKCVPNYPVLGKRVLRDNGNWYKTLKRDNVELVTTPIKRIVPSGVELGDGRTIELDALVYATGFQASEFLGKIDVTGRNGLPLRQYWDGDPRAYLGITIPHFPNLFCLYGPNVNIVHGGSMIFMSECGVRHITESVKYLLEHGHRTLEPREDVHDAYNRVIDEANSMRTWGVPSVSSWYKNNKGRVTQCWPLRFADYWNWTKSINPDDFNFG